MALTGAGSLFVRTTNLTATNSTRGQNLLFPLCIASFSLNFDSTNSEAFCLIDGKRQITAAAITQEIASLNLSFEFADFSTLGFAYDEVAQTTTSIQIPVIKTATVPTATPYEINDAEIVAGNLASVLVYKNSPTTSYMVSSVSAPTTAEQFQATAGKITFAAASAGASVSYSILKPLTSIQTLGVEATADTFGILEFNGIIYQANGERYGIRVPRLSRISTPSIEVSGDVSTLEVEFRASTPAGSRRPFNLFKLA